MTSRKRLISIICAIAAFCGVAAAAEDPGCGTGASLQPGYTFAFMGDLHFDRSHHHDMGWVTNTHPGDVQQIRNYTQVTLQNSPRLLETVVHTLHAQDRNVFAILQGGDFVEGLCGSYELQRMQFAEAIAFVSQSALSVPFLMTKGNHDVTGPGADKAYSDMILPWLQGQLEMTMQGTSYCAEHKGDLFVFFDSYKPDLDWLGKILERHPARHFFFVIHQPVVPYNARSKWHIFARSEDRTRRERLLSLLGRYHAIVLSGHLHNYSILRRRTADGCFFQLGLSSVIHTRGSHGELLTGPDAYGPELVNRESSFDPATKQERRETLENEKPFIDYFELADAAGYSLVTVEDNSVCIDVHLGSDPMPWRRHVIDSKGTIVHRTQPLSPRITTR